MKPSEPASITPHCDEASTQSRRLWVKQFLLGTVATLSGPRWIETVCADVTPTGPGPAVIRLKVGDIMMTNDFGQVVPALASVGGSVQYDFNGSFQPFTLNRVEVNRFVALSSKCTHFGCGVGRYRDHLIGEDNSMPPQPIYAAYMLCPCHGSRYDIEGRVFRGSNGQSTEPAQRDLPRYEISYDVATDTACITIPEVNLHINSITVQQRGPGANIRFKLVFPVTSYSTYEILYQTDLTAAATRVPFSTTPGGVANQTSLFQTTSGDFTAYVDAVGPRGFFNVGLKLDQVV